MLEPPATTGRPTPTPASASRPETQGRRAGGRTTARATARAAASADPDVRLLAALADPIRLRIVRQLADSEAVCVCDLDACRSVSQPTVSHHLRILREAGVVRAERRGTWIYYSLDPTVHDRLAGIVRSIQPPADDQLAPGSTAARRGRRLPVLR